MTTEKIEDIAKKIQRHRDLEISVNASNNAVGRSFTLYNNEEQQFWLINKQATVLRFQCDITGAVMPETAYGVKTAYSGDGFPIPRDSKLGGLLIENHEGIHKYLTPKGEIEIKILNRATYIPSIYDGEYATDINIRIAGDGKIYSYQNIAKILSLQIEIEEDTKRLQNATTEEAKLLGERIAKKEQEKRVYIDKAQSFIRKYAQLRYQPILDPTQELIKRSKIFDGTLIINGGPGTGKTTLLIQRIKYLISPTIEEVTKLTQVQKEILFDQKTSWIFYSPNELLALYLRNSMKIEELSADTERVKVWSTHKNELIKTYRFVSEMKRPFLIYNKANGESLFTNSSSSILSIIERFDSFYINFQKEKLKKITEIDVNSFKWRHIGKSIQDYIKDKTSVKKIEELIRLYINLSNNYQKESQEIADEYSALIKNIAFRIQVIIQKDEDRLHSISVLLRQWKTETADNEDEDDEDVEIDQEDFDEKEELTAFDLERELFIKLKSLCRKQALKKFDKNIKLGKRDKALLLLIPEAEDELEYDSLGQTAYYKKFFERIIKGIVANILREIPMIYKKYRREQFNTNSSNWNLRMLEDLVKKDKNSRIHSDEQALLLYFVNNIIAKIYKTSPEEFKNINHAYIKGFNANCKPVIGIDEAPDFSVIDLLAINSFRHPELSCVTLSGDLMQRMTTEGIKTWEDYTHSISNCEVKELELSYRQSPTLLSLAKSIYKKSTGQIPKYQSKIEEDDSEPKPLMLISPDEDEKITWIANRILEIYIRYKEINVFPSIAIFLPEENQLEEFANKLGSTDALSDVGILVKACRNGEVLGDKNTVRVFSIKVIKGLEFEAVFFHNLDLIQFMDKDLLLKYLYVGLSRATFYLGLTLSEELIKDISFIKDSFDDIGKSWEL